MKTTYHLDAGEISQAVADYICCKIGKTQRCDISIKVAPDYDFADRPTGTYSISATVTVDTGRTALAKEQG